MPPVYGLIFTTAHVVCHMKREGKACETKGLQENSMAGMEKRGFKNANSTVSLGQFGQSSTPF